MKTMTKKNVLKLAMMVMATFLFTGTWAQTLGSEIPGHDAIPPVTYATDGITYMVAGDNIPVYALPDPVYHGNWDYAGGIWTLTDGFVWNWSRTGTGNDTGSGTVTFSQNGENDNYVEISIDQAGQYEIQVTEEAPAAFGGCEGSPTELIIQVVPTPTATLGALAGEDDSFCITDGGFPSAVNATISGGWQNFRLVWTLEIATLDGSLVKDEWFETDLTTSLGVALEYAVEYTTADPEEVAAQGDHDIMSVASFGLINNKPTVYTYNLISINDQALRFGDFITRGGDESDASAFRYNAIGQTYTIQVNPAPVTGPIYHIPDTWAQ